MEKFLNEKGRKIIGWDEILEGGIAPNATIMSWRGEKGGIEAARQGHDVIMTPNSYYYLDYYQSEDIANEPFGIGGYLPVEKCYSYEPAENDLTPEQKEHILGIQGNMWTEYVAEESHLQYMILPRLAALAECQWCDAQNKNWDRFSAAAVRFCKMYEVMGYSYATHIFQVKGDVVANPAEKSVTVALATQGETPIRYTLDGTKPNKKSPVYTEPLVLTESCVLTAMPVRNNVEPKCYTRKFDFHKAVGKKVTFSREVNTRYAQGGAVNLTDGVRATEVHKSIDWVSWRGDAVDLVVDMESTEPYSSVSFGMLSNKSSRIFLPVKLAIAVSEDGVNYTEVASQEYEEESKDAPDDKITEYSFSFPETSARYIKVTGTPVDVLPEWHYNAGARVYIYFDEIIVR
jgi:hexosaminidase